MRNPYSKSCEGRKSCNQGEERNGVLALFDISISDIDCRYINTFEKYRYRYRCRKGISEKYRYRYRYQQGDFGKYRYQYRQGHFRKYRYRYQYRHI